MTTKAETKKEVLINLRITNLMAEELKEFEINISETCREALQEAIDWERSPRGKAAAKHRKEMK